MRRPSRRKAALLIGLVLAAAGLWLLWRTGVVGRLGGSAPRPNLLLISIDSLRPDHLGAYGYPRPTSPRLDALAADGVVFENAVSTTTWTLPSHISIFTSLYPEVHRVVRGRRQLDPRAVLLPQLLRQAGYATGAVVSGPFLAGRFGYARGFDDYDDHSIHFKNHDESHHGITSPTVHAKALEWLEGWRTKRSAAPFFLFLHYWDVHYDYAPPPPFDTRFDPDYAGDVTARNYDYNRRIRADMDRRDLEHVIALYDGEIAYVDSYLGRLFTYLREHDLYRSTLIAVVSDHGDEFFEHGRKGHRHNLFNTTLTVPLILKLPDEVPRGKRLTRLAGLIDIAPTLLEAAGLEAPPVFEGRSLLTAIRGRPDTAPRTYFADLRGRLKCVLVGRWKLIRGPEVPDGPHLFDLASDPGETRDLAAERPDQVRALAALHDHWLATIGRGGNRLEVKPLEYDEAMRKTLESLGYVD